MGSIQEEGRKPEEPQEPPEIVAPPDPEPSRAKIRKRPRRGPDPSDCDFLDGILAEFLAADALKIAGTGGDASETPGLRKDARGAVQPLEEAHHVPKLGGIIPAEWGRLQDLCGRSFTLEAVTDANGPLCAHSCSAAEFLEHKVQGNHVWLNAPLEDLRRVIDLYLTQKTLSPHDTSACILVQIGRAHV